MRRIMRPASGNRSVPARRFIAIVLLVSILGLPGLLVGSAAGPQFGLPLAGEPGPSSWYVSQWYGNTIWAHRNWQDLYRAGQGLHFGVDFAAPCGTEVISIGDGVVYAVDGPYGSPPHNVVIDHQNGLLSLYGHLGERSHLSVGSPILKGDAVGRVGDPARADCKLAPHLHLEVRRQGMGVATNPVPLIDADWRAATIGVRTQGLQFELDYALPVNGMHTHDQPDVHFGGANLNEGVEGWPPR